MADKKISELASATKTNPEDLLLIIENPQDSPTNKNITVENLFRTVPVKAKFDEGLETNSIDTQILNLSTQEAPSSSSDYNSFIGTFTYDDTFLYIRIGPKLIKRVRLESF